MKKIIPILFVGFACFLPLLRMIQSAVPKEWSIKEIEKVDNCVRDKGWNYVILSGEPCLEITIWHGFKPEIIILGAKDLEQTFSIPYTTSSEAITMAVREEVDRLKKIEEDNRDYEIKQKERERKEKEWNGHVITEVNSLLKGK